MKPHSPHTSHTSHSSYLLVTPRLLCATSIVSSFPSFGGVPRRGGVVAIPRSKIHPPIRLIRPIRPITPPKTVSHNPKQ